MDQTLQTLISKLSVDSTVRNSCDPTVHEVSSHIRDSCPVDILVRDLETSKLLPEVYCLLVEHLVANAPVKYLLPDISELLLRCKSQVDCYADETSAAETTDKKFGRLYSDLASSLYNRGSTGSLAHEEDACGDRAFASSASRGLITLQTFVKLLTSFHSIYQSCQRLQELHHCAKVVRRITTIFSRKAFLICLEHQEDHRWTSSVSMKSAKVLLKTICIANDCESIKTLLNSDDTLSTKFLKDCLSDILPRLSRNEWKLNPSMPHVFCHCLQHIHQPAMTNHLAMLLPPLLLFVDDFQAEYRLLGLDGIRHIVSQCSKTELRWFGRADVMYDSLQRAFCGCDKEVLEAVIVCLFDVLEVVEASPRNAVDRHGHHAADSKHDQMFTKYLSDMEMESAFVQRRVYSRHLGTFIKKLGVMIIKHLSWLLRVVNGYLEVHDGPLDVSRIAILEAVIILIHEAWPRIPGHANFLMKSLVRVLCDTTADKESLSTVESARTDVVERVMQCVKLLKCVCPEYEKLDDEFFAEVMNGSSLSSV